MSAQKRLSRARRLGEESESAVISGTCLPLEHVPDDENEHVDARFVDVFAPNQDVDAAGLVVVENGTLAEIKSCVDVYGQNERRGRWHFKKTQHEYLEANDGVYILTVVDDDRDVLVATIVPPNLVDQELIESWIEDEDADYSKAAWSGVFSPEEVN